jgi:gamma-glutamyltranspeptidase/glutathione hydrolase
MTAADLSEFRAEWVIPISTSYHGWRVYELPPNSQGVAALEMLNIMERFPLAKLGPQNPESIHVKIEAQKLAYQDLRRYNADPRSAGVPVAGLLDKTYAARRAQAIDPERANCDAKPGRPSGGDTIYLTVVDRDGNIVSLIQSLFEAFGSAVVVEGMGFHLQNRGAGFSFDAGHPNALGPRKRPFHTTIPGFLERDNIHIGFGIVGGPNQPQAHAQFISNLVDYGMNIQAALDAPRFFKPAEGGCEVRIEGRVPPQAIAALRAKSHQVDVRGDYSFYMGPGQVVLHDSAAKVNYGASSPRGDGCAIPERPVFKTGR